MHFRLKRFAAILIAAVMMIASLPVTALAEELPTLLEEGTAVIPEGDSSHGYLEDIVITYDYDRSAELPDYVFSKDTTDYTVGLPNTGNVNFALKTNSADGKELYAAALYNGKYESNAGVTATEEFTLSPTYNFKEGYSSVFYTGVTGTISIIVGTKDENGELTDTDVYNFTATAMPCLSYASISRGSKEDAVMLSEFSESNACDSELKVLKTSEAESFKVSISLSGRTDLYANGNKFSSAYSGDISLEGLDPDTDGIYTVPLKAVSQDNPELCKEYSIKVYTKDYRPIVTANAAETIEVEKDTPVTMSVTATLPEGVQGELSYQWWHGYREIEGATSSEYTAPGFKKNGYEDFTCKVSIEVDGITYTGEAETEVFVKLTYINKPVIAENIFAPTKNYDAEPYRTEYKSGETPDMLAFSLASDREFSVEWTYSFYVNDKPSAEGATEITEVTEKGYSSGEYLKPRYTIDRSFETGVYYLFVRVTAADRYDPERFVYTDGEPIKLTFAAPVYEDWKGGGTSDDPYLISSVEDLAAIRTYVNEKNDWLNGICFKLTGDITLPVDWEPIGKTSTPRAAFGGAIDGDGHTLTVAEGGKPLLNLVSAAVIKNLDIYGKRIEGCGLIDSYFVDYGPDGDYWTGCPVCVTIDNVKLLSGTSTLQSGFLTGSGSGANTITITNCVVESGVIIGYDKSYSGIGSFVGGAFNGEIDNCVSYAEVYGKNKVGGIAGGKGQSMGKCIVRNSAFIGKIEASGQNVGGIIGQGYISGSAPNTMPVSVINNYVDADITGGTNVGGIFGSEGGLRKAVNDAVLRDSIFYGTLTATDEDGVVGGIVGYYRGINDKIDCTNNWFYDKSGTVTEAFGKIDFNEKDTTAEAFGQQGAKTPKEFADGTVLTLLNEGTYKNWKQGKLYPVLNDEPVVIGFDYSGECKTEYFVGDELDLTGLEFTAKWSNGAETTVALEDIIISGYDKNERGIQKVTLTYGAASIEIEVTVLKRPTADKNTISVSLSIMGDIKHEVTSSDKHTLSGGGLQTWSATTEYEADLNATVWDVLQKAFEAAGITCENPSGNYIESLTYNGVTIGELTNGNLSGWMYTLNGSHSLNGIAQQFLNEGDEIIFHYTDDYTAEDGSQYIDNGEISSDKKYTPAEIEDIYKAVGDKLSSIGVPVVGSVGGEWAVIGLVRGGRDISEEYYKNAAEYVKQNIDENGRLHRSRSTDNSRVILALTALGYDVTDVGGYNLLNGLSDIDYVQKQGINGAIWALIALDSHGYKIPKSSNEVSQATREKLIEAILNAQLSDGGWNIADGAANPDLTAMAVTALAPYYKNDNISAKTGNEVKTAVDRALERLSEMQLGNGGYSGVDGMCAESCAQVLVALTALGIDPDTDTRFVKNGRSVIDALADHYADGSFKHIVSGSADGMATEQSYYALAAYYRFKTDKTSFYDMSDVEVRLSGNDKNEDNPSTGYPLNTAVCFVSALTAVLLAVKGKRIYKK